MITALLILTVAVRLPGAEEKLRLARQHDPISGTYIVKLGGAPADPEAVVRELAAAYRGRLVPYARAGSSDFAVMLRESAARALALDERVAAVEEQEKTPQSAPVHTNIRARVESGGQTWDSGTYHYDADGNISSIGTDRYDYDAVSRVVSGTAGFGREQKYTYDAAGNIRTIVTDGDVAHPARLAVDPASNRLNKQGDFTFSATYDTAGNQTSDNAGNAYRYDGAGMLAESSVYGVHQAYLYAPGSQRLALVELVTAQNGAVSPAISHYTIRDESGAVLRTLDQVVSTNTWSWSEDYILSGSGILAAEINGPQRVTHFFPDHLGTPRLITGSGGAKLAEHKYYPYGVEATYAQDAEPIKFGGQERDNVSQDYLHARYDNPLIGRFLTADPASGNAERPQSWHRYGFTSGNPVNRTDPSGMEDRRSDYDCDITQPAMIATQAAKIALLQQQTNHEWGFGVGVTQDHDLVLSNLYEGTTLDIDAGQGFDLRTDKLTNTSVAVIKDTDAVAVASFHIHPPDNTFGIRNGSLYRSDGVEPDAGDINSVAEMHYVPAYIISPSTRQLFVVDKDLKVREILSNEDFDRWYAAAMRRVFEEIARRLLMALSSFR